ncbi:hypothetical protein TKK_0007838 [Trichogramma kaykai]
MKFDVFGLPIANPSSSSSSSFTDEEKNRLEILQPKGKPRPPQPAYDPYHRMNMDRLKSTLVSIKKLMSTTTVITTPTTNASRI